MGKLEFKGWWSEDDKDGCPEPWETFRIILHGDEAGDVADTEDDINSILEASGYKLILKKREE